MRLPLFVSATILGEIGEESAPGRSRTYGQRFRKPLLYPLSYGGRKRCARPEDDSTKLRSGQRKRRKLVVGHFGGRLGGGDGDVLGRRAGTRPAPTGGLGGWGGEGDAYGRRAGARKARTGGFFLGGGGVKERMTRGGGGRARGRHVPEGLGGGGEGDLYGRWAGARKARIGGFGGEGEGDAYGRWAGTRPAPTGGLRGEGEGDAYGRWAGARKARIGGFWGGRRG